MFFKKNKRVDKRKAIEDSQTRLYYLSKYEKKYFEYTPGIVKLDKKIIFDTPEEYQKYMDDLFEKTYDLFDNKFLKVYIEDIQNGIGGSDVPCGLFHKKMLDSYFYESIEDIILIVLFDIARFTRQKRGIYDYFKYSFYDYLHLPYAYDSSSALAFSFLFDKINPTPPPKEIQNIDFDDLLNNMHYYFKLIYLNESPYSEKLYGAYTENIISDVIALREVFKFKYDKDEDFSRELLYQKEIEIDFLASLNKIIDNINSQQSEIKEMKKLLKEMSHDGFNEVLHLYKIKIK